ncbi:hypothetical protein A3H26_01130 [candidate division WWE3 bacterium RIFCSPLOWO2_12_FULL_36_10]|uniref:DUF2933 domain-containing protein n=1 Tax=candidate division WWE3 bacterium RIFCSPLOWO2_12_FULL_36_10 TaxID=1802630 RepID=A0A1F4VGY2_UNCKA|nr:MAG: hypothetical protein A3H26_01130 [candidate division WWE3 bacterium RIFCSPLOWO2_12_FULL_36_10]
MDHSEADESIKNNIFTLRNLVICLGVLGLFATLIFVFKLPINTVAIFSFVLLCPLMHFWMMKGGHKH